ncbi:hypothetical protein [Sulfitobacter geojensis]|uniref:hypothetical protein n=1 Tax=Sulfitobacter geojensis TaxID=1342299 RepID=UPI0007D8DA76|nr:hypothetical protein [Sulfitobacter geojensis]OAN97320.1 hypothetical protein A8B74_10930 [Sulfitobacter geojensis]
MSKLMIIGSSHVGAYKNAAEAFARAYPDIDVSFFAMRGPLFLMGSMDDAGTFTPSFRNDKDRAFVRETNGAELAHTDGIDHLLLVGHRFAFGNLTSLLQDHDVLEGVRTGRAKLISEGLLKEIIENVAVTSVGEALAQLNGYEKPVTFAMAPYPASSIVVRAKNYEMARLLELFWGRPDAAWVFELWLDHVRQALADEGHALLVQPDAVNAGPFATKPEFADRAASVDGDTLNNTDHRHMNADFGLAMLHAYAENHLGLAPQETANATLNERIA